MRGKLKNSPVLERWFYAQSPLVITRPALKETAMAVGHLLGGFLLSCGTVAGAPAPFALGLLAAAGGGLRGLCALVGAAAGFLTMHPFSQGLELCSSAILVFVTMYIFGSLWVTRQTWFRCLVPGGMRAVVGLIFLMSHRITPLLISVYAQNVLLSALSPLAFSALQEKRKRSIGALAALDFFLIGAARIALPFGLCLGTLLSASASALGARRGDPGTALILGAGTGLAMDAALMTGGLWTLYLALGALVGSALPRKRPLLRSLFFLAAASAGAAYTGDISLPLFLTFAGGLGLSFLLPAGLLVGREESAVSQSAATVEERLSCGAAALKQLYDAMGLDPRQQQEDRERRLFDRAAGQVCRKCSRYRACWERNGDATFAAFSGAQSAILRRGEARREDFPESFAEACRGMDELLSALDQELNELTAASRDKSRELERRTILSRSLLHLSRLLDEDARCLRSSVRVPEAAYEVRIAVSARGRRGRALSGDRGMSFYTGDGRFFAILCDGAGTGQEAAEESLLAVDTLSGLIQAGMSPEASMEFLNNLYVLRSTGGFSTMDILELNLLSGQAMLYKWGAAPSFIRSGQTVKKVGTAAPPPGLGVGSTVGPEVIRLSLWGGDLLVLVSDGVLGEDTEERIRAFQGENLKALSNLLLAGAAETGGEDDMTAAVFRLEEARS